MKKGNKSITCPHCGKTISAGVDTIIRLKDAAHYLGISKWTLYRLTCERKIEFSKPNNRIIYFTKRGLDAYASKNPIKLSA